MTTPGRNSPCPCGSGRKFKQCCHRTYGAEDSLRLRLLAADVLGPEYVAEAWDEFLGWPDEPTPPDEAPDPGTAFDAFLAFSFVPDPAERELPAGWPVEPLALHVLNREPDAIPSIHRAFIEQACRSPASFFKVEATSPGRAVDLQDIMTGRRFHVLTQAASSTLEPGDVTYTRVLTLDGASVLLGTSPWLIPAAWRIPIIDLRDQWRPRRLLTRDEVEAYSIELRDFYHDIVHALQHPQRPHLTNTDGDPIEPTTLTYQLSVPAAAAIDRLLPLATLGDDVHIGDETTDAAGAPVGASLTWIRADKGKQRSWDSTVLGTLRVEGSRLVVEVNSARRATRIRREIRRLLGTGGLLVDTSTLDVDEMLEAARAANAGEGRDAPRSPELESIERELRRRHLEAWLDTRIPALVNRTPRQAAKTPRGRERLEALLDGIADSPHPDARAEAEELRRRLGLS